MTEHARCAKVKSTLSLEACLTSQLAPRAPRLGRSTYSCSRRASRCDEALLTPTLSPQCPASLKQSRLNCSGLCGLESMLCLSDVCSLKTELCLSAPDS